jgi:hypothetical protein
VSDSSAPEYERALARMVARLGCRVFDELLSG